MTADAGIERLVAPDSPGGDGWDDFVQFSEVRNAGLRVGDRHDLEATPEYRLSLWQQAGQKPPEAVVARVDGRIVGAAQYDRDTPDVDPVGWVKVDVLPEFRGRGLGAALNDAIERVAADDGRATVIAAFATPSRAGATVAASNGSGEVPADDPGVRFAFANGYTLGQVERLSLLPLPIRAALLAELDASAVERAGSAYRVVSWRGATPGEFVDDVAAMRERISVDAPSGDVDWPAEVWDAERLRADEERRLKGGAETLYAAALHEASDRLVAFTELTVRPANATAHQGDTLVLPGHRGHRLGMLVKIANLRALQDARADVTGVLTGNAAENSYMLSINDALGFETYVFTGVWQKSL